MSVTNQNPEVIETEPKPGYAEWRVHAELRYAELSRKYWECRNEASRLEGEMNDLAGVMGNGRSGGTAWTVYKPPDFH